MTWHGFGYDLRPRRGPKDGMPEPGGGPGR